MTCHPFRLALIVALAARATAAQAPDTLQRVVITATRVPAATAAGIATTAVIDRAAIERSGVRDVADLLRLVPGVSVARTGGPGAQTSLFLRGGENDYVRLLVDGVAVNDPGGALDLAWLSVDDVERIEIVRGPASVLYGTDAMTGVIQVFTRRAAATSVEGEASRGRYETSLWRGTAMRAGRGWTTLGGLARERTAGILPFNNGYARDVLSGALRAAPVRGPSLSIALRHVRDEFHFPTDGAGAITDRNAFRASRRTIASASGAYQWTRVRTEWSLSALRLNGRDDDRPDSPADTLGFHTYDARQRVRRTTADARVHVRLASGAIVTAGAELAGEAQRGADSSNFDVARHRFAADRDNIAFYTQWLLESGRWSLSAGLRWDDNDAFGAFRTARAGFAARPWPGGSLRASVGTAFKAPTFFESFSTAFSVGNPDLAPERSRAWEAGVRQELRDGTLALSATWFDQRFVDLIQYAYVSPSDPNYFNVAVASARGLELEAAVRPSGRLSGSISATVLRTRVEDAGLQSGDGAVFVRGSRLLRRPPVVLAGVLAATLPRHVTAHLAVRHVGERDDRDFSTFPATPVVLPAHTVVGVAASRPVLLPWASVTADVTIRVDNLLGAGYEEVANYRAPGRSLTMGVRAASLRR